MRLVDLDEILEDDIFQTDEDTTFEPDPVSGSVLDPIPKMIKEFYRESLEDETLGVAETIKVSLVKKTRDGYEIVKVLE